MTRSQTRYCNSMVSKSEQLSEQESATMIWSFCSHVSRWSCKAAGSLRAEKGFIRCKITRTHAPTGKLLRELTTLCMREHEMGQDGNNQGRNEHIKKSGQHPTSREFFVKILSPRKMIYFVAGVWEREREEERMWGNHIKVQYFSLLKWKKIPLKPNL